MSQYHNREQDKIIKLKRFLKKIKMPSAEIFRKLINGGDGGGVSGPESTQKLSILASIKFGPKKICNRTRGTVDNYGL